MSGEISAICTERERPPPTKIKNLIKRMINKVIEDWDERITHSAPS